MNVEQAIAKAKSRLRLCDYQDEMLNNKGLAEAYRREAEWLRVVLGLAMQPAQAGEGGQNEEGGKNNG
jgi:hypothetical protein